MDASWERLKEGWVAVNERMAKLGLSPRTSDEGAVKLNVGGTNVTVSLHLLAETEGFEDSTLFALLEGVWGKDLIPRDASGRIVLDESPACIKHIMHTMLRDSTVNGAAGRASKRAKRVSENAAHSTVAIDEVPCLIYTAHVMRLPGSVPTSSKYPSMNGASTILEPFEIAPFAAKIREWVGGSTEDMTLIYRATRDGFDTKLFTPGGKEDIKSHVVSLIRVSSGEGVDDDSVVGGYSILPWGSGLGSKQTIAAETFLFMLKNGAATRKDVFKPSKWKPFPKEVGQRYTLNERHGACVGANGLFTCLDGTTGNYTLTTRRKAFDVEEGSPFLALDGKRVIDVEVYRYSTPAPPSTTALGTTEPGDTLTDMEAPDIRLFGEIIASSLMEERVVLDRAVKEMETAGARVSAAADALNTMYGPSVAAGEQDTVVELNVRGTRMTTLRSTLQVCPRSALAAMFDAERWPGSGKDKDEYGGRVIDCNPTYFSKILDVLRMRKRASWSRDAKAGKAGEKRGEVAGLVEEGGVVLPGGVHIKEADAEAFGKAVNVYFRGCENFIMDLVQPV